MNNPLTDSTSKVIKLVTQANTHGKIVIGVDFDFTLYDSTQSYRDMAFYDDILDLVIQAQESPHCIICLWTASKNLPEVLAATVLAGIRWDHVNTSPLFPDSTARKPHFNLLLDDAAGLGESVQILTEFLHRMKDQK